MHSVPSSSAFSITRASSVSMLAGPGVRSSTESVLVSGPAAAYRVRMETGYAQFCPVALASELLTRRWTPLVIRELLCGSHRFNDLRRGVPRMSPSLLSRRLSELEEGGIVERRPAPDGGDHFEYHLTAAGEELRPIVVQMGVWGRRWVQHEISRENLDAGLLMWDIQRRVPEDSLPDHQVVVHFEFEDAPEGEEMYWLVLAPHKTDLCLRDPGYPVDLEVETDVLTLTKVWMGDLHFGQALRHEAIRVYGPTSLRRAFPEWLGLSLFASVGRPDH